MTEFTKKDGEEAGGSGIDTSALEQMDTYEQHMAKIGEEEKHNKVGEVYGEIAKNALVKWNGLSEEEAAEKVASSTFDELEGMVGASSSIKAACEAISITFYLEASGTELFDAVMHGDTNGLFKKATEDVEDLSFSEHFEDSGDESLENKEKYILDVLSDIHDDWCAKNEAKFFDMNRANKRYQFLKLEAIGFNEATSDLLFVEPILKKIGMDVNIDNLEEQYRSYPYPIDSDYRGILDNFYDNGGDDGNIPTGALFAEGLRDNPSEYLSDGASEKIEKAIRGYAIAITKQVGEHRMHEEVDGYAISAYMMGGEDGANEYWIKKSVDPDYDPNYRSSEDYYKELQTMDWDPESDID